MLLINILGFAMMAFIVWWFWLWKPKANPAAEPIRKSDVEEESSSELP
jgi:plastocyanin domain-containing protein